MARVQFHDDMKNTIRSITYIPDHYVNIPGIWTNESNEEVTLRAGTGVVFDRQTMVLRPATTWAECNGFVFSEQRYHAGETTGVPVLIHGIVDAHKVFLLNGTPINFEQFNVPMIDLVAGVRGMDTSTVKDTKTNNKSK